MSTFRVFSQIKGGVAPHTPPPMSPHPCAQACTCASTSQENCKNTEFYFQNGWYPKGQGHRFEHKFFIQWWRRLQTLQKHIGNTLHVGPNNFTGPDPVIDEKHEV